MNGTRTAVVGLLLACGLGPDASGTTFPAISLEYAVRHSHVIVAGSINRIDLGDREASKSDVAHVNVARVLKTSTRDMPVEVVDLVAIKLWGRPWGPAQRTKGEQGVWLLRRLPGTSMLAALYPMSFQPLAKEEEIVSLLVKQKEEILPKQPGRPVPERAVCKGLVAHWSAEGNAKDSAEKNHGTLRNGVTFAPGKIGQAFKLDGKDDYIDFGNPEALQVTGSQTIAMWIRPDRLGVRQHPLAKDYTGEGTIALEANGRLMYFFGPTGKRIPPSLVSGYKSNNGNWLQIVAFWFV